MTSRAAPSSTPYARDARDRPLNQAAVAHLGIVKDVLEGYAEEAGMADPEDVALQLQTLMMGAIVSAGRGDREAAHRARGIAELILDNGTHRGDLTGQSPGSCVAAPGRVPLGALAAGR